MLFARGSSQLRAQTRSPTLLADSLPSEPPGKSKNARVGSLSLLQQIFLTQESNQGLLHCRQILYQLSHQGPPRMLEWVAYPFSSESSRPRNQTGVSLYCRWILYQLSYQGSPNLLVHISFKYHMGCTYPQMIRCLSKMKI